MAAVLDAMRTDLVVALKARDVTRVSALRVALAAVANATAVDPAGPTTATGLGGDVAGRELTASDVIAVLRAEHDDLRDRAAALRARGAVDAAIELDARATVVAGYLPVAPEA